MAELTRGMLPPELEREAVRRGLLDKLDTTVGPNTGSIKTRRVGLKEQLAALLGGMLGDDRQAHATAGNLATGADVATLGIPSAMYDGAQDIEQGTEQKDPMTRARGAVGMLAPVAAAGQIPARVAKGILGATGIGLGGAAAYDMLGADSADAATLTRRQQRQVEMDKQNAANAAAVETQKMETGARIEREAKDAEAKAQLEREQAARDAEANMPFRERFPTLNAALPFAAVGAPLVAGGAIKAGITRLGNKAVGQFDKAIGRAERAHSAGAPINKQLAAKELEAHLEPKGMLDKVGSVGKHFSPGVAGGFLGAEAGMLPTQVDSFLPYGNEDGDAARAAMKGGDLYANQASRFGIGFLGGMTGAKLLNPVYPFKVPDTARAKALRGILDSPSNLQNPRNSKGQFVSPKK